MRLSISNDLKLYWSTCPLGEIANSLSMANWNRRLCSTDRHTLYGKFSSDFSSKGLSGVAIFYTYTETLRRTLRLLRFQSSLLNVYFCELWLHNTKNKFRLSVKFVLLSIILLRVEPGLLCPPGDVSFEIAGEILALIALLVVYLATFRRLSHRSYALLSLVVIMVPVCFTLTMKCNVKLWGALVWTPSFIFVYTLFVFLPMRIDICVCLVATFIMTVEVIDLVYDSSHRYQPQEEVNSTQSMPLWAHFNVSRLVRFREQSVKRTWVMTIVRDLVWIFGILSACYIRFWNDLRQKVAFMELGKSVQAKKQCLRAHHGKVRWIESVMPMEVSAEYRRMQKDNEHLPTNEWVYIRTFENVSILFTDIVNFTQISSSLSATNVVMLLNRVMQNFDRLCEQNQCEKIGTIGDCYYCVSGGLYPQEDHAGCCVDLGLAMCRSMHNPGLGQTEKIDIRVGVHTGRVNAAIIGAKRFRYDIYSHDVIIANEMESSGRPGQVHVSQVTFRLLNNRYRTTRGADLIVEHAIEAQRFGLAQNCLSLKTYFVECKLSGSGRRPRSSIRIDHSVELTPPHDVDSEQSEYSDLFMETESDDSLSQSDLAKMDLDNEPAEKRLQWVGQELSPISLAEINLIHQTGVEQIQHDVQLIRDLRADSSKPYRLFQIPPLRYVSLQFKSSEVEWHYQTHMQHYIKHTIIDSIKLIPLGDAVFLFIIIALISFLGILITYGNLSVLLFIGFMLLGLVLFGLLCFTMVTFEEHLAGYRLRVCRHLCIHSLTREALMSLFSCLPACLSATLHLTYPAGCDAKERHFLLSTIDFVCVMVHCIPAGSSTSWLRVISCLLSLAVTNLAWSGLPADAVTTGPLCLVGLTGVQGVSEASLSFIHAVQLASCLALVFVLTRESERTSRICFFVYRDAEIETESAEKAVTEANDLLYNIIPEYVFKEMNSDSKFGGSNLHYAVAHPLIGVAFICVANFFVNMYNEDDAGEENSLRLLHRIICSFDDLLCHNAFQGVEKIKSIEANYLVAAGLNRVVADDYADANFHLVQLMRYCLMAQKRLRVLSQQETGSSDRLATKIGYNLGPVTAGVLGNVKPLYDIWGDTVNVASRMCHNAPVHVIQVPVSVRDRLSGLFQFTYLGDLFVKGKGMMKTYACGDASQFDYQ